MTHAPPDIGGPDARATSRVRTAWRTLAPVAAVAVTFALVPVAVGGSRTWMGLATAVVVTIGYAIGVNLVFGLTGQLLLCVGALGAIGGYGTALLADEAGWPVTPSMVVATVVAAVLGGLFCWISVRRSLGTVFTGIVTLTFGLGVESVLLAQRRLTGGEDGRRIGAVDDTLLDDPVGGYLVVLVAVVALLLLFTAVARSHHGWAYRALREDETTAALAGVDVARQRVHAGVVGAGTIGLVGALQAVTEGFVTPHVYSFVAVDVTALVVLAVGGFGHVLAPVVGAVVVGLLDELVLRDLGTLRVAVEGAALVVLFLSFPDGMLGTVRGRRWGLRP